MQHIHVRLAYMPQINRNQVCTWVCTCIHIQSMVSLNGGSKPVNDASMRRYLVQLVVQCTYLAGGGMAGFVGYQFRAICATFGAVSP